MAAAAGARLFGRFLGRTVSEAAAFGAGVALGPVLGPPTQLLRNTVNAAYPYVPPDAGTLAAGVAQGQVDETRARTWAKERGYGDDAFTALLRIADVGPGMAQAFNLWRRSKIDEAGFRRALKRLALEEEWIDALWNVREEVLDPSDLARAIHRGLIPDPGLLQGTLPSGVGNVPAYPVYPIDAIAEALAAGFNKDHLGVLVGLQGLPMGSHEAAQALFRGVLLEDDYLRAIAEGNTRNEWADAIKEQSRAIPSVSNYVAGRLRGWLTDPEMYAGTGRHGMTPKDTDLEFLIQGRPLTQHQVFVSLRRGGEYDGPTTMIPPPILKAMQESSLRPEWYNLAFHGLETYPGVFALRALGQDGDLDEKQVEQILLFEGWNAELAATVAAKWQPTATAAKIDPWIAKAEGQLWTAIHKDYVKNNAPRAAADTALQHIVTDPATRDKIFVLWDAERTLNATPAATP